MAKPPIIISNGGIADALTEGLEAIDQTKEAHAVLMDNVRKMNKLVLDRKTNDPKYPVVRKLKEDADQIGKKSQRGGGNPDLDAVVLWRLKGEDDEYEDIEIGEL
jgi:hypothetical protein